MTEDKVYHPRGLTLDDFGDASWTRKWPKVEGGDDKVTEVVVTDDHHPDWFRVEACGRGFKWPFSVPEHTVLVAKEKEL